MKIEQEIISKFKNEFHKAAVNLYYTSSFLYAKQQKILKEYGITLPQFNVLRILRGRHPEPATVNLLMERMVNKTSNASRIVEKLKSKKLVNRKQNNHDRRSVNVMITQKGLDLLEEIDKIESNFYSDIQNLTKTEALEFNRILDKIRG